MQFREMVVLRDELLDFGHRTIRFVGCLFGIRRVALLWGHVAQPVQLASGNQRTPKQLLGRQSFFAGRRIRLGRRRLGADNDRRPLIRIG